MNKIYLGAIALLILGCRCPNPTDEEVIKYVKDNDISQEEIEYFVESNPDHTDQYESIMKNYGNTNIIVKGGIQGSNRQKSSEVNVSDFKITSVEEGGK